MQEKRAIINLSDDQYERIKEAAKRLGLTVPAFCRLAALEKTNA